MGDNMTQFSVYRNGQYSHKIVPIKAIMKKAIMFPYILELEVPPDVDLRINDEIQFTFGGKLQRFVCRSNNVGKIVAEHITYELNNYILMDTFSLQNYDTNISFADMSLDVLINTYLKQYFLDKVGYTLIDNSNSNALRDIDFSDVTLLQALQIIAETYEVEFEIDDATKTITIVKQTHDDKEAIPVYYGVTYEKANVNIDKSHIVTRIYPVGASENVGALDGYPYNALRPVAFNLSSGTITDSKLSFDIEEFCPNCELTYANYPVERVVDFPDISLNNTKGTISDITIYTEDTKQYGAIKPVEDLSAILTQSEADLIAKKCHLYLAKGLKSYDKINIKRIDVTNNLIVFNPKISDGTFITDDDVKSELIGGEFILVGYITQANYNAARQALISAAEDYLLEHNSPKITYTIQNLKINTSLDVGMKIAINDNRYDFNEVLRIQEFSYDLAHEYYTNIKLTSFMEAISISSVKLQKYMLKKINETDKKIYSTYSLAKTIENKHNLLINSNFYGDETEYLKIGSQDRNYVLEGMSAKVSKYYDNVATVYKVRFTWSDTRFAALSDGIYYNINEGTEILNITEDTYYKYIFIQLEDGKPDSGNNKLILSDDKDIVPPTGYKYYLFGIIAVHPDKDPEFATSYGFTYIDGNVVATGQIVADEIKVGIVKMPETTAEYSQPKRLLIYYGYPSGWRSETIGWSSNHLKLKAIDIAKNHDIVVFPDVWHVSHSDHEDTITMIRYMKQYNPNIEIFSYVELGDRSSDTQYSLEEIQIAIDNSYSMGYDGIFLDEFGFDYGVSRERMIAAVNMVHAKGMKIMANGWNNVYYFGSKEAYDTDDPYQYSKEYPLRLFPENIDDTTDPDNYIIQLPSFIKIYNGSFDGETARIYSQEIDNNFDNVFLTTGIANSTDGTANTVKIPKTVGDIKTAALNYTLYIQFVESTFDIDVSTLDPIPWDLENDYFLLESYPFDRHWESPYHARFRDTSTLFYRVNEIKESWGVFSAYKDAKLMSIATISEEEATNPELVKMLIDIIGWFAYGVGLEAAGLALIHYDELPYGLNLNFPKIWNVKDYKELSGYESNSTVDLGNDIERKSYTYNFAYGTITYEIDNIPNLYGDGDEGHLLHKLEVIDNVHKNADGTGKVIYKYLYDENNVYDENFVWSKNYVAYFKEHQYLMDILGGTDFTYINGGTITTGKIQGKYQTTVIDLDADLIDIGNGAVKLGKGVLTTGGNGLRITQTADTDDGLEIVYDRTGNNDLKTFLGKDGIRQIYSISVIDQIDDSYGLSIPVYIPQNTDGSETSTGKARIIVKAEKFRAYSKGAAITSATKTADTVYQWDGIGANTKTGTATDDPDPVTTSAGNHSHTGESGYAGGHSHSISDDVASYFTDTVEGHSHIYKRRIATVTATTSNHKHTISIDSGGEHSHLISAADIAACHYHDIQLSQFEHSHRVNISHGHSLIYGIYESSDTATITVKKGTNTLGSVTTGNSIDINNEAVNDGDVINITSSGLARVQVYIFVEFYLR